jgi:hypothetical protein
MLLAKPRVQLPELRVDAELVRDLAELVPVLIDKSPFRFGVDLEEMTDDGEPLRRVNEDELSAGTLDLATDCFVAATQGRPSLVLLRGEERMRLTRDQIRFQDHSGILELKIEN